jgi:hypothetical protein
MLSVSRLLWGGRWLVPAALLVAALLAAWAGRRPVGPARPVGPLDDWDIPRLVAYLNGQGLGLRAVSTQKEGTVGPTAFLTATGQEWDDFNRLPKDARRIGRWRGILYCERGAGGEARSGLIRQWDDRSLEAGPFLFFGDPDLLALVRAALAPLAPEA